jgi:cytochrome c
MKPSTGAIGALILATSVLGIGCRKPEPQQSATIPAIRYEAHIAAGGVAPPAGQLVVPPKRFASDVTAGQGLFSSMSCDGCHGGGALGWQGPSLVDGRWRYGGADEEIFQSIFYGRPKGMPAYGGVLGAEGVWMIVRYLKAQPVPAVVPTTSYEDLASNAVPTAAAATAPIASQPEAADPLSRLAKYGCTACHALDTKVVGPSFKEVAAKYQGRGDAAQMLEQKVRNGGAGVWGDIPMPPNPAVPDTELHAIVQWILTSTSKGQG